MRHSCRPVGTLHMSLSQTTGSRPMATTCRPAGTESQIEQWQPPLAEIRCHDKKKSLPNETVKPLNSMRF
jgi:hypothetical protein